MITFLPFINILYLQIGPLISLHFLCWKIKATFNDIGHLKKNGIVSSPCSQILPLLN